MMRREAAVRQQIVCADCVNLSAKRAAYPGMPCASRRIISLTLFPLRAHPRRHNNRAGGALLFRKEVVARINDPETSFPITQPGTYRVQVRVSPLMPLPDAKKWITWIYTNPFFVTP
ncbi:MAG: hypothetical protein HUU57_02070 [Bdellovibrio sp.]|nr:hypothetical protein [Bdellovibrio sp.]